MLSVAAGTAGSWFGSLPMFWRAQLVGWSLFFVLDLVNRLLTYHNSVLAIIVSLVVWPCLVLLSTGLAAIYASRKIGNRLTLRSLALIVLLSASAAMVAVAVGFIIRQIVG
jgi:two-component system LytT family sensor kinase